MVVGTSLETSLRLRSILLGTVSHTCTPMNVRNAVSILDSNASRAW